MTQQNDIEIQPLRYDVRGVKASAYKQIESMCNAITFINTGTQPVTISPLSIVLQAGQSFLVSGDTGELDVTQYECYFDSTIPGTIPELTIVRKTYK